MSAADLDDADLRHWRALITATGAVEWIEALIDSRLRDALHLIDAAPLTPAVRTALADMAATCTQRAA
jgi:geranylgeranyl diphosphate synthase type I